MKRLIAILAMLTMLLACGCSNSADEPQNNGTDNNVTDNNVTDDQNNNGTENDNNTVGDDIRDGMDDAGNAIETGMDDADNSDADQIESHIAMRRAWSASGRLCSFALFFPVTL